MSEKNNSVNLAINGSYKFCYLEKIVVGYNEEYEMDTIKLKMIIDGVEYINTKDFLDMELAIVDLQKLLPINVQITCCQSCKHGNFCPCGDNDNEIFCLINYNPSDKRDVIEILSSDKHRILPNELLYWCDKYDKINEDYYTYNDWNYYFRNNDSRKI